MKLRCVALSAVLLLALTGCTGTPETAPSEPGTNAQSTPVETVEAEATSEQVEGAPMTVESIEATAPTRQELQSTWYSRFGKTLESYGYEFPFINDSLPVGQYICDQSRAGVAPEDIAAVQGLREDHEYANTQVVDLTLNNGYALSEEEMAAGVTLPDYCGVLFPAA